MAASHIGDPHMPLRHAFRSRSAIVAIVLVFSATAALAAPMDVQLNFSSLPSAQGWTYAAVGSHTGTPEANVFAIGGGALAMNTIGQSNGVAGGSILYNLSGGITSTEIKELQVRARCTGVEPSATAPQGQGGFCFGFTTAASRQYAFAISDTRVMVLIPTGFFVFATAYDNTQFHDYRFVWSTPNNGTFSLFRDGALVGTSNTGFPVADNRIFFGDGTGGANGNGEISSLRFLQGSATSIDAESWGRLKSLYH